VGTSGGISAIGTLAAIAGAGFIAFVTSLLGWTPIVARNVMVGGVGGALRDYLLGDATWSALDPPVRTFIATGEKVYREHRSDAAFDFAAVIGSFSKALEIQLGSLLRHVLPKLPKQQRLMNIDGVTVDLTLRRGLTLSQIVHVLAGDQARSAALAHALVNGGWLTGSFAAVLDEFRTVRNEGTHERRIDRKTATQWRNQLLGIGGMGHFVELAKIRLRS